MSAKFPILADKHYDKPSTFTPENLLREARRQKSFGKGSVPEICALDPDGDLVRRFKATGNAHLDASWACYHTELYRLSEDGLELGLLGCAVGASFAVLVAEQLFASGCQLLISVTSAGQLVGSCSGSGIEDVQDLLDPGCSQIGVRSIGCR